MRCVYCRNAIRRDFFVYFVFFLFFSASPKYKFCLCVSVVLAVCRMFGARHIGANSPKSYSRIPDGSDSEI